MAMMAVGGRWAGRAARGFGAGNGSRAAERAAHRGAWVCLGARSTPGRV